MRIELNKVTWYSKLLALILFITLPFIGFYIGIQYQKTLSQNTNKQIETTKKNATNKDETTNLTGTNKNRNRSCGKSTMFLISQVSNEKVKEYLEKNSLEVVKEDGTTQWEQTGSTYKIVITPYQDNYWITKFKEDGIGTGVFDTVGCDFRD